MEEDLCLPCGLLAFDALGVEAMPDNQFFSFLGDLAAEDPLDDPAAVPPSLALHDAAGQLPPPAWQGTAGGGVVQLQQQQQSTSRASPCSSAGSAEATNCPGSPAASSGAALTTPDSAATAAPSVAAAAAAPRKRLRVRPAKPASPTAVQSKQQERERSESPESESEDHQPTLTKAQLAAAKRRAPVVDWRAIDDPEERRKQRRLAKNRVTAARSRERKKEQMAEMEQRLSQLEAENGSMRTLLQSLMAENTSLKEQLASLNRGAAAALPAHENSPKPAVLVKCLAIMHLVCCLMGARVSLSLVVPVLWVMLQQGACAAGSSSSCGAAAPVALRSPLCSSLGSVEWPESSSEAVQQCRERSEWWRVRWRPGVGGAQVCCCC